MARSGFRFVDGHLYSGNELIALTPKEMAVLSLLAKSHGAPVPTASLIAAVWGEEPVGSESLHRCVSTLRGKLGRFHQGPTIVTHHRIGYSLASDILETALPQGSIGVAELYRQAMEVAGGRTRQGFDLALQLLDRAIQLDPMFLPARTLKGHALVSLATHRYAPPSDAGTRLVTLSDEILSRFPSSAEAYGLRGFARSVIFAEAGGFADLDRAVELAPGHWLIRFYRAWARTGSGDFADAIDDLEIASLHNPGGVGLVGSYAYLTFCAGHPEKALAYLRAVEHTGRLVASGQSAHAVIASWLGFHEEAVAAGRRCADVLEGSPTMAMALPYALARAGETTEAAEIVDRLVADRSCPPAPSMLAPVQLALGRAADAALSLAAAEEEKCVYRHIARFDPRLRALAP